VSVPSRKPEGPPAGKPARLAAWRARAEGAYDRYQREAQHRPVLNLPLAFVARYAAKQGVLLASATAFRLFLWLLPFALLLGGVLAATGADGDTARSAAGTAGITGTTSREIVDTITSGHKSWVQAVVFGAVLFLWASWTLIRVLTTMNAHVWQVPIPPRRLRPAVTTTFTFAGACLVIVASVVAISRIHRAFPGQLVLATVVEAAAVAVAWLAVCLHLPDNRTSWIDLVPGCLLVGAGLAILNTVGQFYIPVRLEHASKLYGSLGVAGAILAWLLLVGQVMVCAAVTNSVWADYRRRS
jgi:membrane protein